MAKHLALLSYICIIISCTMRKPESNYTQLIKGDWLGQKQPEGFEHDQTEFLSFEDSTCHAPFMHDVIKYEILQGALYLTTEKEDKKGPRNKFTIVKLTADSLVLFSGKKQQNTIRYSKIHPKNTITPAAIYFASSGCYGSCPIMNLEIDSNRNVRFYGDRYTSITGGYKGKLSKTVYNSIINKVRNLPVDSLKEFYSASWTDDETLGIAIAYGNKVIRLAAYGHEEEPIELYILLTQLKNLYKEINLQPDASVRKEDFISNPKLKAITSLLTPPVNIRKFTPPKLED
ncbi:MAG TPA: DUF6438 domain-containing protein [Niastella sp.]